MTYQPIQYLNGSEIDSFFQSLRDQQSEFPFLNPQAGSPFPNFDFSEISNDCLEFHLDSPIINFRKESEDTSYESYQPFQEDQITDSSQGSTAASPSYYQYENSPISSDNTEINYDQPFKIIRSNCSRPNQSQDDTPKKRKSGSRQTKQNKMKNYPGLITQRLKTKLTTDERFLDRILRFTRIDLTSNEEDEFLEHVQGYSKDWKTWAKVSEHLNKNEKFGSIFLKVILAFLTRNFEKDYEEWLVNGKMNEKSKTLLRDSKEFFIEKFSSIHIEETKTPVKKLKIY